MASSRDAAARVLDFEAYASHGRVIHAGEAVGSEVPAELWTLLLALDTLEHCIAFHDRMGRLQHANHAFLAELERTDAGDALRRQISQFAQAAAGLAASARLGRVVHRVEDRAAVSLRGEYTLHGTYIGADLFGSGSSILISLTPPAVDVCTAERLVERFQLTRAQARVARLLAEGLRNDEIAQRLFLSAHTVRHHIEQIRAKVGGHTRAAVAARLRGKA